MTIKEMAEAISYRNEWLAFLYGDTDPVVIAHARTYAQLITVGHLS